MVHQVFAPRVLLETQHVLAVHKPPGLNFHSVSPTQPGLLQQLRDSQASGGMPGGYAGRLWPVHRLDTVTSGIVLFAKSARAASYLAECFRRKAVIKVGMHMHAHTQEVLSSMVACQHTGY